MPLLLGIDNGLTVTKAVVFDETGRVLATARRRVAQSMPRPRHVERDMDGLWRETAAAIAQVVAACGRPADQIAAVAATAHGDGLYLLDRQARPLGPGILSLDSRAADLAQAWRQDGTADAALARTGQVPHASAPSALLAWIRDHQPDRLAAIGHVLSCKDWLTFCLTGRIGTDLTEAGTAFGDVTSQTLDPDILSLFGLSGLAHALPEVACPDEVVGRVGIAAAAATGLAPGTPVVAGLHDVTASALGAGGYGEGVVAIVAGTYSINETVTLRPRIDPRWFCRNGLRRGEWNAMAISPASATNYDWFLDTFCGAERTAARAAGGDLHARLMAEVNTALTRPSTVLFHPFLFGSPHGAHASGAFLGLHGWHDRGQMLRAVVEGIVFNHRHHVDALRQGFAPRSARLTGGMARSPVLAQLFADALDLEVGVTDTEEAAAWGAALCAGSGVGLFASPRHDPRGTHAPSRVHHPDPQRAAVLSRRFAVYNELVEALSPVWPRVEALGEMT